MIYWGRFVAQFVSKSEIKAEYERRLEARRTVLARLEKQEARIADVRLVVFLALPVLAWLAFVSQKITGWWLVLPLVAFGVLIGLHERSRRAIRRASRAALFYQKGLARLDDCWAGTGEPGTRFLDPEHPYSADLDLFGPGSLYERLCTARTPAGQAQLASWLLAPATPEEIHARHQAVDEVRPRLDLREELDLLGDDVRTGIDPDALASWGRAPRSIPQTFPRVLAIGLATVASATLLLWCVTPLGRLPFLATLCLEIAFFMLMRPRVHEVLAGVDLRTHDLVLLAALLEKLEREPFQSPALQALESALRVGGRPASEQIAQLAKLVRRLSWMKNQFFAPIGLLLLRPIQWAFAIDAWRGRSGPAIGGWLAAVGAFEALSSLGCYAFENPSNPFPELVVDETCFEAEALGHPLIPDRACIRNDFALGGERRIALVSGSNMSGKSTLLRAVGINTVLALAGAPVCAKKLRISPLAIGATLRIQDSLQAGRSRFYAEITRIRQIVDLSNGPLALLFLLDEILHGTNSHDRRIGAESIVRGLIERGAIGLVTTHDLALTDFADGLAPRAINVHFEDHFENGTMRFDYVMRPGVVRKSNALALMRAVGLDV